MGDTAKDGKNNIPNLKCKYCGEDKHEFAEPSGNPCRSSFGDKMIIKKEKHPWNLEGKTVSISCYGLKNNSIDYTEGTIQLHHLIPCSVMKYVINKKHKPTVGSVCIDMGYDINQPENGVWLPSYLELACHLRVPLHNGGHPLEYYDAVYGLIKEKIEDAIKGEYCPDKYANFIAELNEISKDILKKVMKFELNFQLTKDGDHYEKASKTGCGNLDYNSDKNKIEYENCEFDRNHFKSKFADKLESYKKEISVGK